MLRQFQRHCIIATVRKTFDKIKTSRNPEADCTTGKNLAGNHAGLSRASKTQIPVALGFYVLMGPSLASPAFCTPPKIPSALVMPASGLWNYPSLWVFAHIWNVFHSSRVLFILLFSYFLGLRWSFTVSCEIFSSNQHLKPGQTCTFYESLIRKKFLNFSQNHLKGW